MSLNMKFLNTKTYMTGIITTTPRNSFRYSVAATSSLVAYYSNCPCFCEPSSFNFFRQSLQLFSRTRDKLQTEFNSSSNPNTISPETAVQLYLFLKKKHVHDLLSIFFYYMFYMYCMQKSNFFIFCFQKARLNCHFLKQSRAKLLQAF